MQQTQLSEKRSKMQTAEASRSSARAAAESSLIEFQQEVDTLLKSQETLNEKCEKAKIDQPGLVTSQGRLERNVEEAEKRLSAAKKDLQANKDHQDRIARNLTEFEGQSGRVAEQLATVLDRSEGVKSGESGDEKAFELFVVREREETKAMEKNLAGLQAVLREALASAAEGMRVKKARVAAEAEEGKELARQAELRVQQAQRDTQDIEKQEAMLARIHASLST